MPTPAIQTLITDAQQVLNLKSLSEIRATMAAALANANVGTPLNPNLTTQQLWDQFYLIVRQPESDIESIITNQLMKFLFAPPAPGGVGGNHEVIYNNNGVLAGDPKFLWDDALNKLDIDGSATISGDLTVGTNALKVFPANNRVLINQTSAIQGDSLEVTSKSNAGAIALFGRASDNSSVISFRANGAPTQKAAIQGNDTGLEFVAGTTIKQTINPSTGDITVSLGNLVMGTSGKGIDFSATSGTGTSELLADYEEGTFTATLTGGTTNPTIPVTTTARYTKVGRLVTVQIEFINVSTVGASGTIGISGLPFVNGSVASTGIATLYGLATFTGSPVVFLDSTTSALVFYGLVSNSNYSSVTHNAGVSGYSTTTITYSV